MSGMLEQHFQGVALHQGLQHTHFQARLSTALFWDVIVYNWADLLHRLWSQTQSWAEASAALGRRGVGCLLDVVRRAGHLGSLSLSQSNAASCRWQRSGVLLPAGSGTTNDHDGHESIVILVGGGHAHPAH